MRVSKLLMLTAATCLAGAFAGSAAASPNCPVCQQAYSNCVNNDPTNEVACAAQYSICLSYCGIPAGITALQPSPLDVRKYRPDMTAMSRATTALPQQTTLRAP